MCIYVLKYVLMYVSRPADANHPRKKERSLASSCCCCCLVSRKERKRARNGIFLGRVEDIVIGLAAHPEISRPNERTIHAYPRRYLGRYLSSREPNLRGELETKRTLTMQIITMVMVR